MFTLTASAAHAQVPTRFHPRPHHPPSAPPRPAPFASPPRATPSTRHARSSHVAQMGMDTGNPFVDGWLDLTDTVSGGGKDLGVSELAEKLGKDIYMDINGW